jgi:hypothetical protein
MRDDSLRRLVRVLEDLGATAEGKPLQADQLGGAERLVLATRAGELSVVAAPWGTRGYDDLRIRASRENLGRGLRPAIASVVDLARMLEASPRTVDVERLRRLQRMMELERRLDRDRRLQRGLRVQR